MKSSLKPPPSSTLNVSEWLEKCLPLISRLILFTALASLVLFTLYSYRARFHSDAATAAMLSLEQWRTGSLFVKGWYYSQDFWPMFVFNSATLFFPIVHDAFLATQAGVLIQSAIVFFATRHLLIQLGSKITANLLLAFLFSGVSFIWSEFFYGQGQYGNVLMFLLLDTALIVKLFKMSNDNLKSWYWVAFFLLNVYMNSTSVRYLAFLVGPALLSLGYLFYTQSTPAVKIRNIALLLLISSVCGQILFTFLKHSYTFLQGADGATFISYHDILLTNLPRVIEGYLSLIVDEEVGVKFASLAGIGYAQRFFFCVILFTGPFYVLTMQWGKIVSNLDAIEKYLVLYFVGLAGISFFAVVFLAFTVNAVAAARYIMVPIFFGVLISAIFLNKWQLKNSNLVLLALMLPAFFFNIHSLHSGLLSSAGGEKDQLVKFLKVNGLERGFANYWNADALTVLSNYQVMVAHIENERPIPWLFMTSKEFYKPVGAKQNFLLLETSEIPKFDFEPIRKSMGEPARILKFNRYQIFVYDGEFATHLPGWN